MKTLVAIAALVLAGSLTQGHAASAKANWDEHCAKCHGKDGTGDTKMGQKLHVRNLTEPKVQASFTDEQAVKDIKEGMKVEGRKVMPGFSEKISETEIKGLVMYLRTFKKG